MRMGDKRWFPKEDKHPGSDLVIAMVLPFPSFLSETIVFIAVTSGTLKLNPNPKHTALT